METAIAIFLLLFVLVLTIVFIWYCTESILNSLPGRVGYVSSNVRLCLPILDDIITKYIANPSKIALIEPGAGLGHIGRALAKKYKWKQSVAIELNFTLIWLGKFLNLRTRSPLQFQRQNMFDYHYPKGSFIYCYLTTPILDKLHTQGKFKGCFVVCLSFSIPRVLPVQELKIANWQKKILVYDFR